MRLVIRVVMMMATVATTIVVVALPARAEGGVRAEFEGQIIDLSEGWGAARACASTDEATRCFRSEAAMDKWLEGADQETGAALLASCSTSLRLYSGTSYTGQVLYLSTRSLWLNLSAYGFDNLTSSYRVGACSVYMAENSSGGGSWYPGNTSAGAQASAMLSGWNNRVSSIYIQ